MAILCYLLKKKRNDQRQVTFDTNGNIQNMKVIEDIAKSDDTYFGFSSARDLVAAILTEASAEDALFVPSVDIFLLNNWTEERIELVPLKTTMDGNCLFHAASIGVFEHEDRSLSLRNQLHVCMTNHFFIK